MLQYISGRADLKSNGRTINDDSEVVDGGSTMALSH